MRWLVWVMGAMAAIVVVGYGCSAGPGGGGAGDASGAWMGVLLAVLVIGVIGAFFGVVTWLYRRRDRDRINQ